MIVASQPALARAAVQTLAAITNCASGSPCSDWTNTGSGTTDQGTAFATDGVKGFTSGTGKSGVYGETDSAAGGYGARGANLSPNGFGVYGSGRTGVGVWANASGSKPSLRSNATIGHAADLLSASGVGAVIAGGSNAANGVNFALQSFGRGAPGARSSAA